MEREELLERLRGVERDDFEVKAAQVGIPEDSYKTVSAFSNSSGGWLVLGVAERRGAFEIVGVADADGMQNAFLGACRNAEKFSRPIEVRPRLYDFDGRPVLAFHVRPAARFDKPVRVKVGRHWGTYIRSGGGDHRCTGVEEARFLRDASSDTFDALVCQDAPLSEIDQPSLAWFRGLIALRKPALALPGLDTPSYLEEAGLLRGKGELTHAAALLFGKDRLLSRLKPGGLVDFRLHHAPMGDKAPEGRWDDRELCEGNLVATLRILLERLFRLVPQPFAANAKTGEREAESPDFISVREALVNLLIHQDYSDVHRTARILWFRDAAVFENPGDSFASISRMLDGGSSEVRNPTLVRLLRQAGFAEQAGSGIPKIVRTWRGARRLPPTIENDPGRKVFRLTLDWEPLASKRDELWYRRLGVEISEDAGRLLTFARTAGAFDLTSARLVTGLSGRASVTLVSQLVTQHLVEVDETDEETVYKLAPRLEELWEKTDAPAPGRRAGATEGMTEGISEGISEGITDRKARLADMIRERPGLRGPQLSVALNLPASTVDRYLSQLRKAGLIEHRGARRTGGYFPRSTKRK